MRIGLIADIHANLIALDAVLEDMPAVDRIACAGDIVGYNPYPAACIDRLQHHDVVSICGNHDKAVVEETGFAFNSMANAGVEYAIDQLDADQLDWLQSLPTQRQLVDSAITLVHGHPDDPNRYTYPDDFSPGLLSDEDVLVMGHTHVQHVEQYTEGIVINPGSVGQPRDGDPRAAYGVVDLETLSAETYRVPYDIDTVQQKIDEVGLPSRLGERLEEGR